jgi:hypothetical protein
MKNKLTILAILFLFFLVFPFSAKAGIFDEVNPINLTYNNVYSLSGVYGISNMITHDNQVEVVYASPSGIKNLVITESGGSWSGNIYTVSSQIITSENGISLIQNSSDIHAFYCNGTVMKHYYAKKGDHIWSFVEDISDCIYGNTVFTFDKNEIDMYGVYSNYTQFPFPMTRTKYAEKIGGSWNFISKDVYGETKTRYISQSIKTDNRFFTYHDGIGFAGRADKNLDEITSPASIKTGVLNTINEQRYLRGSAIGFKEIDAIYYATMNCTDTSGILCNAIYGSKYQLYYVFDTPDTLGVNCSVTAGTNWYSCGSYMPNTSTSFSLQTATGTIEGAGGRYMNVPLKIDSLGNLHLLYSANDNSLVHLFQKNSKSIWIFDRITSMTTEHRARDFAIYGSGIMAYYINEGSNEAYFLYEGTSLTYVGISPPTPPAPPNIPTSPYSADFKGLMCGSGVWLTGSTYEGGCLVASLFILAVVLSAIGWIFKYIEHEYKENEVKIPDKDMISGAIIMIMIIAFTAIGMTDMLTGIVSFFMVIAFLMAYKRRAEK